MAKEKISFKEFLETVAPEHQAFVERLNGRLMEQGCVPVIKEAKLVTLHRTNWRRKQ